MEEFIDDHLGFILLLFLVGAFWLVYCLASNKESLRLQMRRECLRSGGIWKATGITDSGDQIFGCEKLQIMTGASK